MTVLIVFSTVAISPFIYPTIVNRIMERSGWLLGLINILAALLGGKILSSILERMRGVSFFDYTRHLLGKPVAYGCNLFLIGITLFHLTITYRVFAEILLTTQLPRTPIWATVTLMVFSSLYLVLLGIDSMGRTGEFYFILAAPVFIAIVLGRAVTGNVSNLQPFTVIPWSNLNDIRIMGSFMAYFGPVLLFLLSHHISQRANVGKACIKIVAWSSVAIFSSALLPVLVFGPEMVDFSTFPLLEVASTLRFHGTLIERIVFVIIIIWQGIVFIAGVVHYYAVSSVLSKLIGSPSYRLVAVLLSPAVIAGALMYKNLVHLFQMYIRWSIIGSAFIVVMIITMLLTIKLKKV